MSIQSTLRRSDVGTAVLLGAIITLANLGTVLHRSSRTYLFQQAQCLNYYRVHDATAINSKYHIEESRCKLPVIQSRLSLVDGVDSFLSCLPRKLFHSVCKHHPPCLRDDALPTDWETLAFVALLILGVYKDATERIGLRRVLVLNLCCEALAVAYSITSCKTLPLAIHHFTHMIQSTFIDPGRRKPPFFPSSLTS